MEKVDWLENWNNNHLTFSKDKMLHWIKEGIPTSPIKDDNILCDKKILENVSQAKVKRTLIML